MILYAAKFSIVKYVPAGTISINLLRIQQYIRTWESNHQIKTATYKTNYLYL